MTRYYQEPEDNNEKDSDFVKAYIRRMLGNDVADYHAGQWDDETEEYYLDGKRVEYGRPNWSAERSSILTSSQIENALGKPTRSLDDYRWDDNRRTPYKTNEYEMFKDKNTIPFNKAG